MYSRRFHTAMPLLLGSNFPLPGSAVLGLGFKPLAVQVSKRREINFLLVVSLFKFGVLARLIFVLGTFWSFKRFPKL